MRPRCTCKLQVCYWGSYWCSKDSCCRKKLDRKWWQRLLKLCKKTGEPLQ